MTLSKIIKAGHENDGVSDWNLKLNAWLLENAEESEEFKPHLSLDAEGRAVAYQDDFKLLENKILSKSKVGAEWRAIRPDDLASISDHEFLSLTDTVEMTQPEVSSDENEVPLNDEAFSEEAQLSHDDQEEVDTSSSEPGYEDGFEEGQRQGFDKGENEATRKYNIELASLSSRLDGIANEITDQKIFQEDALQSDVARLAFHLARQIVRGELSTSASAIEQIIAASMENFSDKSKPLVYLNPHDKSMIDLIGSDQFRSLEMIEDETLAIGSVRLTDGNRRSEDLIEDRLSELAEKLLGNVEPSLFKALTPMSIKKKAPTKTAKKTD